MILDSKHERCGRQGTIVVTRIFGENHYDGYCTFCGDPVFGTLYLRLQESNKRETRDDNPASSV